MLRFLLVVLIFAALVYAVMWTIERRRGQGGGGGGGGGTPPGRGPLGPRSGRGRPEPRQLAPDDDEEFLRGLERKRRKDKSEGGGEPTP